MKKYAEIGGYMGMVLLQGALLPSLFAVLYYRNKITLPMDYLLMLWTGLVLYLIRSIVQKDILYTISNSIGVLSNGVFILILTGVM